MLDPDGQSYVRSRVCGPGMNHFSAVVSQLNGFGKADLGQSGCLRTNARIGGEHAVDVGPDPNLVGPDGRAQNGCGVVGSAASQGGGVTAFGCAAISGANGHP